MSRRRDPHRRDLRADQRDLEITRDLVEEVLLTALALEDVMGALLDEIPEGAFPGEDNAHVLLEMVVDPRARPHRPPRRRRNVPRSRLVTCKPCSRKSEK
jgi:hypothetical protein